MLVRHSARHRSGRYKAEKWATVQLAAAMPPSTGVVEAFKSNPLYSPKFLIHSHHRSIDLIRHGKHHDHHGLRHDTPPTAPPPAKSPPAREVAEIIVKEERKERSKMPTYQGLEQFKLTDKMGESVILLFLFASRAHLHSSGAFSNVYRAVEISSGKNVAG